LKRIIDNIANWLVTLTERKNKTEGDLNAYLRRGRNGIMVALVIILLIFLQISYSFYKDFGNIWLAGTPLVLFAGTLFFVLVGISYKDKLKRRNRSSRLKPVGFNLDFTERILKKIYLSLTRYEFLDEDLTSFEDFYNVLVFDFDEHSSELHFKCTQPQLKYILEKFKQFKKGIHLVSFERSQKVYHKGNLISAETLSKKYSEFPPDSEFESLVDSFFHFLGDI
jgi:hypothetical protein